MKSILRGVLPGSWVNDKGEVFNTSRVFIDYDGLKDDHLVGNKCAEIRFYGDCDSIISLVGKPVILTYVPSGKNVRLMDISAV